MVVRQRALMLLVVAVALFAQGPAPVAPKASPANSNNSGLEQRMAVIETKLDNLKALDDRVSKLNDKIDGLNLQLAAISAKADLIQWIGAIIGAMILASVGKLLMTDQLGSSSNETTALKIEVERLLAHGHYLERELSLREKKSGLEERSL